MRIKKSVGVFALFTIEIFLAYCYRNQLLEFVTFLNDESRNFFDDIFIGIIGSLLFSVLQFINLFFIEKFVFYSKRTFILFFQKIFQCNISDIKSTINDMMKFVFKANKKWRVYQKSDSTKIANTSEGILACVYAVSSGYELTPEERKELCTIIDKMLDELDENGFKSYNENTFTVHCTAMGAFAIKKAVDLDLYEIKEENEEKIRSCMKKMLRNANEEGWGFKNEYTLEKGYNRALSTIWAFRALNVWGVQGISNM